jgi:hypothetical protein
MMTRRWARRQLFPTDFSGTLAERPHDLTYSRILITRSVRVEERLGPCGVAGSAIASSRAAFQFKRSHHTHANAAAAAAAVAAAAAADADDGDG